MGSINLTTLNTRLTSDPSGRVPCAPGWGIRANGTAYYDPSGAASGEQAWLREDPAGELMLESATGPQAYLLPLEEGAVRPVGTLPGTFQVREKAGMPHPSLRPLRAPVVRDGRPVAITTATPLKVRDGRPVALPEPTPLAVRHKPGLAFAAPAIRQPTLRAPDRPLTPILAAHLARQARRQQKAQQIALNGARQ